MIDRTREGEELEERFSIVSVFRVHLESNDA
jgi:hypothetical protein